jgi:hypothetical protein
LVDRSDKDDIVAFIKLSNWMKLWWNWFYSFEEDHHPWTGSTYEYPRPCDQNQGRIPPSLRPAFKSVQGGPRNRMWFLAGSYGHIMKTTRSILPPGYDHILVPVYNMSASKTEFPGLSDTQLLKLVDRDVNQVRQRGIIATFDGKAVTDHIFKRLSAFTGPIDVEFMPEENILGADTENFKIYSAGYWLLLKDDLLTAGDHSLRIKGESSNYTSDTEFYLTVSGPQSRQR